MTDSDRSDAFELFGETFSQCQTCGQAMVGTKSTCDKCAGKVPIGVLEGLAGKWRAHNGRSTQCATELQEVIENYGDTDE